MMGKVVLCFVVSVQFLCLSCGEAFSSTLPANGGTVQEIAGWSNTPNQSSSMALFDGEAGTGNIVGGSGCREGQNDSGFWLPPVNPSQSTQRETSCTSF
jgi:hypothetical protein